MQPAVRIHAVAVTESAEAEMFSSALISAATSDLLPSESRYFCHHPVDAPGGYRRTSPYISYFSSNLADYWLHRHVLLVGTPHGHLLYPQLHDSADYLAACRQLTRRQVTRHDTELSVWFV